jgi:hypothetical protein
MARLKPIGLFWVMKIKPKLLCTLSEMITAAYQAWLARQVGVVVRTPARAGAKFQRQRCDSIRPQGNELEISTPIGSGYRSRE